MRRLLLCGACVLAAAVLYAFTRTAAALLFLCAAALLPIAALLSARLCADGVSVLLHIPTGIQKGIPVGCKLSIENRSVVPIARVEMTLTIRNTLTGCEEALLLEFPAEPRRKREVDFVFESAFCGQLVIQCEELRVFDFLGMRGIRRSAGIREKRVVPPETFPARVTLTGGENPRGNSEIFSVSRKGSNYSEPLQLRDYVEGDSLKQIHWKLTQKLDRYIVAEPSAELERALLILWDDGKLPKDAPPQVADALAESLVSVCISLAEDEIPFCAAWRHGETGDIVLKEVNAVEDIYDVASGILCTSAGDAGDTLVRELLHELGGKTYPSIACFSYRTPTELIASAQSSNVTAFICAAVGGELDDADGDCYLFSPENYSGVLRDVTV
ncbi:MAG: DUF58 domain-containing protein [Oscillospiraceae bacterium]|nr:DUF58 domain-containing protein [Oscillospiraceae bacterium]